jgi:hypothetical protein
MAQENASGLVKNLIEEVTKLEILLIVIFFTHSSYSYMALQAMSGLGLLFMRFRNLTLIDNW